MAEINKMYLSNKMFSRCTIISKCSKRSNLLIKITKLKTVTDSWARRWQQTKKEKIMTLSPLFYSGVYRSVKFTRLMHFILNTCHHSWNPPTIVSQNRGPQTTFSIGPPKISRNNLSQFHQNLGLNVIHF